MLCHVFWSQVEYKIVCFIFEQLRKNRIFVDLAFCMGSLDLMWVTSSTQNINVAKNQNWGLKQKISTEEILLFNNICYLEKY